MDNKYFQALYQISQCIDEIYLFIGNPMTFEKYDSNTLLQKAVERDLEIIGEAVKRLKEIDDNIEITDARKIINTRNLISHGYDEIQNDRIWSIIIKSLPILKQEVIRLLPKESGKISDVPNPEEGE